MKDRLPEKFKQVLIIGDKGHYGMGVVDSAGEMDDYSLWEGEHATHWQALPEVPSTP